MSIRTQKRKNTKKSHTKANKKRHKLLFSLFFLLVLISLSFFLIFCRRQKPAEKVICPSLPSYIDHGSRSKNKIALTFDADMTPFMLSQLNSGHIKSHYNKEIVDVLRQEKVAATIFMTGLWVEKYPDVTKELFNDPLFEIANHSYSHPGFTPKCFTLPSVPVWGKDQEFIKSQEIIKNITGVYPKFFRFPGGCYDKEDVDLANKHGLTVVGWDAAGDDSFNNNLNSVINNIRTRTQNGSIILLHFNGNKNAPHTVQALKESINYLKEKGFVFVKISELLADGV